MQKILGGKKMNKLEKVLPQKQTIKLYLATVQDEDGKIQRVFTDSNYENLWLTITSESKAMRGFWTIFDKQGVTWRFVDGNYKVPNIR
jgi:hypothetical protein